MANAELLHKVLRHIKDNPSEYDPVRWHRDFAGWTLRLEAGAEVRTDGCDIETMFDADGNRVGVSDIGPWAIRLLGISVDQSFKLFCASNTVDDLERVVREITAGVRA